jgi:hypothetical protein
MRSASSASPSAGTLFAPSGLRSGPGAGGVNCRPSKIAARACSPSTRSSEIVARCGEALTATSELVGVIDIYAKMVRRPSQSSKLSPGAVVIGHMGTHLAVLAL